MATTHEGSVFESFLLVEHGKDWVNDTVDSYFRIYAPESWGFVHLTNHLIEGSGWKNVGPF